MKHVYLMRSIRFPERRYVGITSDIDQRVLAHNGSASPHTSKYCPWRLLKCISFADERRAIDFERYLTFR